MRPAWLPYILYTKYTKLEEKAYLENKCGLLRKLFTLLLTFVTPCCENRQLNGALAAKSKTQGLIEVKQNPSWVKQTAPTQ
jgi:hypothetical protein